jgi:CheY-like chemotaxis protein
MKCTGFPPPWRKIKTLSQPEIPLVEPEQHHRILLALDEALKVFQSSEASLSKVDRDLLLRLEIIRSQVLKAESGHPFPLHPSTPPGASVETEPGGSGAPWGGVEGPEGARPKRIRVLIADDILSVRCILRALLAAEKDFDVIAEAANGREAVELATACHPDIIIMDLNMPVLDGISATRESLRASPESSVIVFSANRDPASMQLSAEAGAVGYICKPATRKVLIAALREVYAGRTAFHDMASA